MTPSFRVRRPLSSGPFSPSPASPTGPDVWPHPAQGARHSVTSAYPIRTFPFAPRRCGFRPAPPCRCPGRSVLKHATSEQPALPLHLCPATLPSRKAARRRITRWHGSRAPAEVLLEKPPSPPHSTPGRGLRAELAQSLPLVTACMASARRPTLCVLTPAMLMRPLRVM